ncbi:MAG: NAD-dependent epimerase/dehydratase family protein [Flavonifractor plautii]|uniref:UDP-glucose 4-epimerase n=1 Tax=Flavonifractor plautii TaxID=292800 RepID=A0A6N3GXJ1_FLAPL|nr:NAD(P)-dependent oxidoreductase [Flavonifractor plautii]
MSKKTIMVTGNLGYIGSVMVPVLVEKGYDVVGYDVGYYENCYLVESKQQLKKQLKKDLRDCCVEDFDGVDYVIHLAGLSNDPLGDFDESLTYAINYEGTMKLAKCAKEAGVKRFAYASSQSVYGISDVSKAADEEGEKNPITAYAKTKWKCECELRELCSDDFAITYLRPATAYGASPNLRCDIVFNAFVAYAFTSKMIEIKSDGTPWRPMSHVHDIISAFIAVLEAPVELIKNQSFNVGTRDNNYTVKQLAEAAQSAVAGCGLTFTGEHTDPRSYRVSADKILTVLKDYYHPQWDIAKGGKELMDYYASINFDRETFDSYKCNRLKCLKKRIAEGDIDENLRVISK